jgi:hypothetical protein
MPLAAWIENARKKQERGSEVCDPATERSGWAAGPIEGSNPVTNGTPDFGRCPVELPQSADFAQLGDSHAR